MTKALLIIVTLFTSSILFANSFTDYKSHIAKDRLIVIFDKSVSAEKKAEIIHASGVVGSFVNVPAPVLTICYTNDFESATRYFKTVSEVTFVSFFMVDEKEHYAGVLNDFFVKLKDKNFEPMLREKLKAEHLNAPVADKYIPNLYRIQNSNTINTIERCAEFLNEGWVEYAAPNYLLNPLVTSNDPLYTRQWAISNQGTTLQGHGTSGADMDVDSAWTVTTGDPSIKIGLIDSGVDTLHPDLIANLLPGHDAVNDSTDGYPTPSYDEDGHGTCCAGILAAVKDNNIGVAGVAPSCKVIPVRSFYYFDVSGNGTILPLSTAAAFSDAISWATDTAHADILSNSWGLPASLILLLPGGTQPVTDAIVQASIHGRNGKGIAMFFSSGNDDDSTTTIWPSSLDQTIAVNATNMCDKRKSPTDCSGENWGGDYGAHLDFSAPGVKIATTDMRGANGFSANEYYYLFNGTSAACPNAAAVGALLLSIRPDLTAEDVRNVIAQSCDKVGGYSYDSLYNNGTWSKELGYGRVNAHKALLLSLSYTSPTAIAEPGKDIEFSVYPNPANSTLNINYSGDKNTMMRLYDMTGNELQMQEIHKGVNTSNIALLPAGIYVVKLDAATNSITKKVTILK